MSLIEDLLAIEEQLWTGGPAAFRRHVDERCLVAFTEMAGVMEREEIARSVEDGPRWRDLHLTAEDALRPARDVAVLTYRAEAVRGADSAYRALVSSGYVNREGEWKMMFHQQTPLSD